jgi:tetratricopeptide (TPR) repeat protein
MPELLSGKHVAFTGRLASMTRAEAAELVQAHGGHFVAMVNRRTSFLVIGQDGWALQKDGRLTNKLRTARSLQQAGYGIKVVSEEELLTQLGSRTPTEGVRRLYSIAELSRLLKIPGNRLRAWVKSGLIHAVETEHGISHFDYSQVVSAKTLCDLIQAGVKSDRLKRSMRQLQRWVKNLEEPMQQLAILERDGELLVRLENGLAEPTGQRCFDFADPVDGETVSLSQPIVPADEWFELGCEHEDAQRFDEAVKAYRQALLTGGPNPTLCFNLANALYALGEKGPASERFYQAVELKPDFVEAWNNLGTALADLGQHEDSLAAYRKALELEPSYADAHYNLADLLEEMGRASEACRHWQAYVQQDPHSEWGRHARGRLARKEQTQKG